MLPRRRRRRRSSSRRSSQRLLLLHTPGESLLPQAAAAKTVSHNALLLLFNGAGTPLSPRSSWNVAAEAAAARPWLEAPAALPAPSLLLPLTRSSALSVGPTAFTCPIGAAARTAESALATAANPAAVRTAEAAAAARTVEAAAARTAEGATAESSGLLSSGAVPPRGLQLQTAAGSSHGRRNTLRQTSPRAKVTSSFRFSAAGCERGFSPVTEASFCSVVSSVFSASGAAAAPPPCAAGASHGCHLGQEFHSDTAEEGSRTPSTTCSEYAKEQHSSAPSAAAFVTGGLGRLINTCCSFFLRGDAAEGCCQRFCSSARSSDRCCCRDASARQSLLLLQHAQLRHTGRRLVGRRAATLEAAGSAAAIRKRRSVTPSAASLEVLLQQHRSLQQQYSGSHPEEPLNLRTSHTSDQRRAEVSECAAGTTCCVGGDETFFSSNRRRQRASGFLPQQLREQQQHVEMDFPAADRGKNGHCSKNSSCRRKPTCCSGHMSSSWVRCSSRSSKGGERRSSMKNSSREKDNEPCNGMNIEEDSKESLISSCARAHHSLPSRRRDVKQGREAIAAANTVGRGEAGACKTAERDNVGMEDELCGRSCLKKEGKRDGPVVSIINSKCRSVRCRRLCEGGNQSSSSRREERTYNSDKSRSTSIHRRNITGRTRAKPKLMMTLKQQDQLKKQQQDQKPRVRSMKGQVSILIKDRKSQRTEAKEQRRQKLGSSAARATDSSVAVLLLSASGPSPVDLSQQRRSEKIAHSSTMTSAAQDLQRGTALMSTAACCNRKSSAAGRTPAAAAGRTLAAAAAADEVPRPTTYAGWFAGDDVVVQQLKKRRRCDQAKEKEEGLLLQQQQQRQKQLPLRCHLPLTVASAASDSGNRSTAAGRAASGAAATYEDGVRVGCSAGNRFTGGGVEEVRDKEKDAEKTQQVAQRQQQQQEQQQEHGQQGQQQRAPSAGESAGDFSRSFLTLLKQLRQRPQQRAVRGSGAVAAALKRRHLAEKRRLLHAWNGGAVGNNRIAQPHGHPQPERQVQSQQPVARKLSEEGITSRCAVYGGSAIAAPPCRHFGSSAPMGSSKQQRLITGELVEESSQQPPEELRDTIRASAAASAPAGAVALPGSPGAVSTAVDAVGTAIGNAAGGDRVAAGAADGAAAAEAQRSCICEGSKAVIPQHHVRPQPRGRLLPSLCSFCPRRLSLAAEQQPQDGSKRRCPQQQEQMQQQHPHLHEQHRVLPHSLMLQRQQASAGVAAEQRREKKRRTRDDSKEAEGQQEQQRQQEVLQERRRLSEGKQAAEEKVGSFSGDLLNRSRDNSRLHCDSSGEPRCIVVGPGRLEAAAGGGAETTTGAAAAVPPAAAAATARRAAALCRGEAQTATGGQTADVKAKKETSMLDGIYWTSVASRPSRRGRVNLVAEGRSNTSSNNSKCNSTINSSRCGDTVSPDGTGDVRSACELGSRSDLLNRLVARRGSEEDRKDRYADTRCICIGIAVTDRSFAHGCYRKVDGSAEEGLHEHGGRDIADAGTAAAVEAAAAGKKESCSSGAGVKGVAVTRGIAAVRGGTCRSDRGRETVVRTVDAATRNGKDSSTAGACGAESAAAATAASPPGAAACSVGWRSGKSTRRGQRHRKRLKIRKSAAAPGGRLIGGEQGALPPAAVCVRHATAVSAIPAAVIGQQGSDEVVGNEVTVERRASWEDAQQQQEQWQLAKEQQVQEQQTEDAQREEQEQRGEGFCVAYIRGLARRGGWERVPPSLLLLLLPSELMVKRSCKKNRSRLRAGSYENRTDAAAGRRSEIEGAARPSEKKKKHAGLLGRRGEIARLLLVQNEWEKASAVSRWKKAREAGRIETLESFRSRVRGEMSPAAGAFRCAGFREHYKDGF